MYNQCSYESSHVGHLRRHLKTHIGDQFEKSDSGDSREFGFSGESGNYGDYGDYGDSDDSGEPLPLLGICFKSIC